MAIRLEPAVLSTFLPSAPALTPLFEASVDLSGRTLQLDGELSVTLAAAQGITPQPGDTFFVARVERLDGVPRLVVVALAGVVGVLPASVRERLSVGWSIGRSR